ncbi:hypothetical protein MNBD_GAMMA15-57 [hydrothermal vent metagenome]|uniref:DUF2069 domain-containing protein n=1 Tax=hydrothermal vent metagenome TaxID=652676 RepID=A0A3B0YKX8_9ZZZZ
MKSRASIYLAVTLFGYFGIMVLLPVWIGWFKPPGLLIPPVAIGLLALPLFFALRGMLHAKRYTVAWSLFMSMFYFTHGVIEAWSEPVGRWGAVTEIILSACWLAGGILWIRATSPKLNNL